MKKLFVILFAAMTTVCSFAADNWEYPTSFPDYLKGSGTITDPYQINCAQDLANLAFFANEGSLDTNGEYYVLNCDIVLNDNLLSDGSYNKENAKQWIPIGTIHSLTSHSFRGTFDGQGHTISGMYVTDVDGNSGTSLGLFGSTEKCTVKNLTIEDSMINGGALCTGGIVGYATYTDITNCTFRGVIVNNTNKHLGGIAGYHAYDNKGRSISDCHFEGTIDYRLGKSLAYYTGGIVGETTSNISDCSVICTISDANVVSNCEYVGGIAGWCRQSISNCTTHKESSITTNDTHYSGGIAGCVNKKITKCRNYSYVSAKKKGKCYMGGIAGQCGEVENSGNFGNINVVLVSNYSEICAGGVAGYCTGNINGSFNLGNVTSLLGGKSYVYIAGIVGYLDGYLSYSFNTGNVRTTGNDINYYDKALIGNGFNCYDPTDRENYYLSESAEFSHSNKWVGSKSLDFFQEYDGTGITTIMEGTWGKGTWGLDPVKKLPVPIEWGGVDAFFVMNGKGSGTSEDPYLITDYFELMKLHNRLVDGVNYEGIYFLQKCDFDFSERRFIPIGSTNNYSDGWKAFHGHYDGGDNTVKNINYTTLSWFPVGFFAEIGEGAEVKNLRFTDNNISASSAGQVGLVAGKATNASLSGIYVRNCSISQNVGNIIDFIGNQIGYNHGAGALVGVFSGNISRCSVYYTDITGNLVGGLAGNIQDNSTVEDAVTHVSLHASQNKISSGFQSFQPQYAGGIASHARNVKVSRCVALPTIDYNTYDSWGFIGGIFGIPIAGSSVEYTMCNMNEPKKTNNIWGHLVGYSGITGAITANNVQIFDKRKYKGNGNEINTDGIKDYVNDLHGWSPIFLNGGASNLDNMHFSYHHALPKKGIGSFAVTSANGEYSATPDMKDYKSDTWTRPSCLYVDLSYPEVATDNNVLIAIDDIDPVVLERKSNVANSMGHVEKLALYDGKPVTYPSELSAKTLKYSRNFTNTSWQPLLVPFTVNYDEWHAAGLELAALHAFKEKTDDSGNKVMAIEVKKVTAGFIPANTPCLVRATAVGEKTLELANVSMKETIAYTRTFNNGEISCKIIPTYLGKNSFGSESTDADFLMKDGKFGRAAANAVLKAQRWHISLSGKSSNASSSL